MLVRYALGGLVALSIATAASAQSTSEPSVLVDVPESGLWPASPPVRVEVTGQVGTVTWPLPQPRIHQGPGGLLSRVVEVLSVLSGADPSVRRTDAMVSWQEQTASVDVSGVQWVGQVVVDGPSGPEVTHAVRLDARPPEPPDVVSAEPVLHVGEPFDAFDQAVATARSGCTSVEWQSGTTPQRVEHFFDEGGGLFFQRSSTNFTQSFEWFWDGDAMVKRVRRGRNPPEEQRFYRHKGGWWSAWEGELGSDGTEEWLSRMQDSGVEVQRTRHGFRAERDGRLLYEADGEYIRRWTQSGQIFTDDELRNYRWDDDHVVAMWDFGTTQWRDVELDGSARPVRLTKTMMSGEVGAVFDGNGRLQAVAGPVAFTPTSAASWHTWQCEPVDRPSWQDTLDMPVGFTPTYVPKRDLPWRESVRSLRACVAGVGLEYLQTRPHWIAAEGCAATVGERLADREYVRTTPSVWVRLHVSGAGVEPLHSQTVIDVAPTRDVPVIVRSELDEPVQCAFIPELDGPVVRLLHAPGDCPVELVQAAADHWLGRSWPTQRLGGVDTPHRPDAFVQVFASAADARDAVGEYGTRPTALPAYTVESPMGATRLPSCPLSMVVDADGIPIALTTACVRAEDLLRPVSLLSRGATEVEEAELPNWWGLVRYWRFEPTGETRRVVVPTGERSGADRRYSQEVLYSDALPERSAARLASVPVLRREPTGTRAVLSSDGVLLQRIELLEAGSHLTVGPDVEWSSVELALAWLDGPSVVDAGRGPQSVQRVSGGNGWVDMADYEPSYSRQVVRPSESMTVAQAFSGLGPYDVLAVRIPEGTDGALHHLPQPEPMELHAVSISDLTAIHQPAPRWPLHVQDEDLSGATCTVTGATLSAVGRLRLPHREDFGPDCGAPYADWTQGLLARWRFESGGAAADLEPFTVRWDADGESQ